MVSRSPRRSLPLLCSCVLLATLASAVAAQTAFQVKDINTTREQLERLVSNEPTVSFKGEYFFTHNDDVHGFELWKTDGTPGNAVMVKDICPGTCNSRVTALTPLGNRLVFVAEDGAHGVELWVTDGTAAGTSLVVDLYPGIDGGAVATRISGAMKEMDGFAYFPADDLLHGQELWKTDGTVAGTTLIADIRPGPESSGAMPKVTSGGLVFFSADDGIVGQEPWLTDGTSGGTRLLKDIRPGAVGSMTFAKDWLATSRGLVFFPAYDVPFDEDFPPDEALWVSNGSWNLSPPELLVWGV